MAEQLLNGRYRLLRPLGTGGMASVYLAEDLRLGRHVAIKILHPQFAADPTFVARFEQEARMAAALAHPNIVQVYDVGHDGDRRYIVMEYVEGETLKETIAREGALPVPRALGIISGLLAALDFAHAHNLIHRDVKSQNILLTPDGTVKVTDFGIARELSGAAAPTLTMTGMVIGTVQYFSPEQAQGRPATPQSDVYAAGIVLYEMLTSTLPFEAENPLAVAMQQINQAPPLPTRRNAAIPPAVEAVVLKALAKNPANRFAGAAEMRAAVEAARASAAAPTRAVPVERHPPSPPGVARPPTRPLAPPAPVEVPAGRNTQRALWITAVALVAVLAALIGVYSRSHNLFGFGNAGATPTPSPTVQPTATSPVPTRPVVVVPPTSTRAPVPTGTPTAPAPTDTTAPVPTDTPVPSATPRATAAPPTATVAPPMATPAPTATAPPPTDTSVPTATSAPPTDTPLPPPTDTPPPPATDTPAAVPSATVAPSPGNTAPTVQFSPSTAGPGTDVFVTGTGWPDGALVTFSSDFGNGTVKLGQVTATGGGFRAVLKLPDDVTAGIYTIDAQDGEGDRTSQTLTVST